MNLRAIMILAVAALLVSGGSAGAKSTSGDHWYIAKGSSQHLTDETRRECR